MGKGPPCPVRIGSASHTLIINFELLEIKAFENWEKKNQNKQTPQSLILFAIGLIQAYLKIPALFQPCWLVNLAMVTNIILN